MPFVVFLIGAFIVSVVLRRRPVYGIMLVVLTALAIPSAAQGNVAPGPHPAAYFAVIYAVCFLAANSSLSSEARVRSGLPAPLMVGFLVLFPFIELFGDRSASEILVRVTSMVVAPLALVLVGRVASTRDADFSRRLAQKILLLVVGISILGVVQEFVPNMVPFAAERAQYYWWWSDNFDRSVSTLASPLDFAAVCLLAIPLVRYVRSVPLRILASFMLLLGIVTSQSRFQLVIGVIAVGIVLLLAKRGVLLVWLTLALVVPRVYDWAIESGLLSGVFSRFADDDNSSAVRIEAYQWFGQNLDQFLVSGFSGPQGLRESGVLNSSLENAYLTLAVGFGLLYAVLYFCYQALVIPLCSQKNEMWGWNMLIVALAVLVFNSYSSFYYESSTMILFGALLALFAPVGTAAKEGQPEHDEPASIGSVTSSKIG